MQKSIWRETFNSPSIDHIYHAGNDNQSLLDLGIKNGINDDQWKRSYRYVVSDDLRVTMRRLLNLKEHSREEYLTKGKFLTYDPNSRFDVILTWDLFNYLDDALLNEVGRRLTQYCHAGTILSVMCYSGSSIPTLPQPFVAMNKSIGLIDGVKNDASASKFRCFNIGENTKGV